MTYLSKILTAISLMLLPMSGANALDKSLDDALGCVAVSELLEREVVEHSEKPLVATYKPFLGRLGPTFQTWFSEKFEAYKRAFIHPDGRVVDVENEGITHSEGQGYGMLLALQADDRETFEAIWRFTCRAMRRTDGLISWRWDPNSHPHVTDRNNATDGDLLIATALALAAIRWDAPNYRQEAKRLAEVIRKKLVVEHDGIHLILPGEHGFRRTRVPIKFASMLGIEQERSPVFNLSYWIFFAFPILDRIDPDPVWRALEASGLALIANAIGGPTEWSVLSEEGFAVPAPGRPRIFAYNAVRIPLYLLLDGYSVPELSHHLHEAWGAPDAVPPATFRHGDLMRLEPLNLSGYRLIHALNHCVHAGEPVDMTLLAENPDTYFSTSLYLLAVNVLYTHHPDCFPPLGANWP